MDKIRNTILMVVLVLSILPAKQTFVVFDFQPVGVDSNTIQVNSVLLKDRLGDLDKFTIINPVPGIGMKC
jgi:hypothetical protein